MKRSIFLPFLFIVPVIFAQEKSKVTIEPVNFSNVLIKDDFWKPKIDKVATKTLAACIYQTEEKNRQNQEFRKGSQRQRRQARRNLF